MVVSTSTSAFALLCSLLFVQLLSLAGLGLVLSERSDAQVKAPHQPWLLVEG